MRNRKITYSILFLLFLLAAILGFMILASKNEDLEVVFFDVGQGDAILVSRGSSQVLIDSGKSGQVLLEKLGRHVPFWDRKIEAVVMTHPDQDHIGGFADVFRSYEVEAVLKTNAKNDSKTFEALNGYIALEKSEVVEAKKGVSIVFADGVKMEIVYPFSSASEISEDTNGSSVVVILHVGKEKFLFTGDLPGEKESEIFNYDIDVDILKVSHHGSKYSTTEEFLRKVSPREAVVSVGKNSYGHPSEDVLSRLRAVNSRIFRTDEKGDIVYRCRSLERKCILQKNPA